MKRDESSRIAKNTILLYFRMLLLMLIGLFTSRAILQSLGIENYGIYNAVGGTVALFTFASGSLASAISRFLACELGIGDKDKLKRVFSTSVVIQLLFSAAVVILVETVGVWLLNNKMDIPADRLPAARWVLQCSTVIIVLGFLSIPFTATIIAHEQMSAYAWISIAEAAAKLGVAIALSISPADKLISYAVLMAVVAFIIRSCYGAYCKRNFEESRGRLVFDRSLVKEMLSFSGWNFLGSGSFILNNHGITLLTNVFFGVTVSGARGIAAQVENIVKQFVNNVVTAINPQISKSYAASDRDYSRSMAIKGAKYACLIIITLGIPLAYETDFLLHIWLREKNVPEITSLLTRLDLLCIAADLACTTISTIVLASGKVRRFYVVSSAIAVTVLPLSWIALRLGAPCWSPYLIFAAVYSIADVAKIIIAQKETGLRAKDFLSQAILPAAAVGAIGFACAAPAFLSMEEGWLRLFAVCICGIGAAAAACWFIALSPGEKEHIIAYVNKRKDTKTS